MYSFCVNNLDTKYEDLVVNMAIFSPDARFYGMEIMQQETLRVLNDYYKWAKERNELFSLRAFARKLEVEPSVLSQFLNGKRNLSEAKLIALIQKIPVDQLTKEKLLQLRSYNEKSYSVYKINDETHFLDEGDFSAISEWYYLAILNILELHDFESNALNISERLNLEANLVLHTLKELEELGCCVRNEDQTWSFTGKYIQTKTDIPSEAIRSHHKQYMQRAIEALDEYEVDERDITGINFTVDKNKLPEAKKLIADFRKHLSVLMSAGKKEEIFRLNIQLFPLSKKKRH